MLGFYLRMHTSARDAVGARCRRRPLIESGETALSIASRLQDQGFINDANLFRLYMRVNGLDKRLAAGDFDLAQNMTMNTIAERLQRPRMQEIAVTFPEGLRAEEIADLLNVQGVMDGEAFLSVVRGGAASARALGDYPFVPDGATTLEGFLFPDTYRLPARAAPADLIQRMLDNFGRRVTANIEQTAAEKGRSLEQVINMASIVEREARRADERPLIASVYWNRLSGACSKDTGGSYLQADPTVQYAAGRPGEWWWKPPSVEAYAGVQSPYNTYLRSGLPPDAHRQPRPLRHPGGSQSGRHEVLLLRGDGRWFARRSR